MENTKKWHILNACPTEELIQYTKSELLSKMLASRGISTLKQAEEFLNPLEIKLLSPSVFADMQKAVNRLKDAITKKEHILIWGDFDADGVTSTALLYKTFQELGADFSHFIPEREAHGHGLNSKVLMGLVSKKKVKVIVTVDCGVSDTKQISLLKGLKVDVIITDHHKAPDVLPEAYAIINPRAQNSLKDDLSVAEISSLSNLAGVGVAHKLALALLEEHSIESVKLEDELLSLAAIGTISDVVPLLGENRVIVAKGLKCINDGAHTGVKALFDDCKKQDAITSTDIAFMLTPRINAVGRLSKTDEAFSLLTAQNTGQLSVSIEHLHNNNKIRQSLCDEIYAQALTMIGKDPTFKKQKAIVLYNPDWHLGIIGIVASKLVDAFNKPAFLVTLDAEGIGRSSARGVLGYNIYDIMQSNESLFLGYGGHTLAGGLSFDPKIHSFEIIKEALLKTLNEMPDIEAGNVLDIDAELYASDLNKDLLDAISSLEPCGQKNPSPVFCIKDATLMSHSFVGKDGAHLKYSCEQQSATLSCVWWGKNTFNIPKGEKLDVAFSPRLNLFNGIETIQLDTCAIRSDAIKPQDMDTVAKIKFYDHRHKVREDILPQISQYLSDENISLRVFALKSSTFDMLKPFPAICERVGVLDKCDAIMFFDYPSSCEELTQLLLVTDARKVHLMREEFEEDVYFYIKRFSGMLKFIANKKEGILEIDKVAKELSLSVLFVKTAIDIFCELGCIGFDGVKITYLKPVLIDELVQSANFDGLLDEFEKVMDFKNTLSYSDEYEKCFSA